MIPVTFCPAGTCPRIDPYQGALKLSTPPSDFKIQYPPVFGSAASATALTPAGYFPASDPYHGAP